MLRATIHSHSDCTCSAEREGRIGLPKIGVCTPITGLQKPYSAVNHLWNVLTTLYEACLVANPLLFGLIEPRNFSISCLVALR